MLYSLLVSVIVLAFLLPVTAIIAFIKGYNMKAEKLDEKPIEVVKEPEKPEPKGDPKLIALLANIDAYDGTEKGQKVIDG